MNTVNIEFIDRLSFLHQGKTLALMNIPVPLSYIINIARRDNDGFIENFSNDVQELIDRLGMYELFQDYGDSIELEKLHGCLKRYIDIHKNDKHFTEFSEFICSLVDENTPYYYNTYKLFSDILNPPTKLHMIK